MTKAKKSTEQRVTAALEAEELFLPSLEESLDDHFGYRFDVPSDVPGLRVAGNWNDEAEQDMLTRMGLIEAVLEDEGGATRAHARGFLLTPLGGFGRLKKSLAVDAADTVNDTYMAAAMAMAGENMLGGKHAVFVVTGFSGRKRADRRTVVEGVLKAIAAWEKQLDAVGIVISPERTQLRRIATRAGTDPDTALQLIEDARRTELGGIALDAHPRAVFLSLGAMSFYESLMALGRFHGGEAPETVLAAPTSGEKQDMIYGAANFPVPVELFLKLRVELEGHRGSNVERIGVAIKLANAHVIATGAAPPGPAPCDGKTLNITATLLSTSLYMRVMAFEVALNDPEVGPMLIQLREQDLADEVFKVAASAPLDPGFGDLPGFLPEFRERIEDLVMAGR